MKRAFVLTILAGVALLAAPAMLFSEIEVQKRAHSLNRPPILPPPSEDANSGKDAGAKQ